MQINPFKLGGGIAVVAVLAGSVLSRNYSVDQRTAPVTLAPASVVAPAVPATTAAANPAGKTAAEPIPATAMPLSVRQPAPPRPAYEPPKAQPGLLPPGVAQGTTFNGRPIQAQQQPAELRDVQRANGGRAFDIPDR